jgi:hypothetical protein
MIKPTSKPQLEKRGRRPIEPEIRRFIYQEDFTNKSQRPENRLPQSVLAHNIHEKLLNRYKGKQRIKIPKVSTIQKMLSKLPKELDEIDNPWDILSLSEFPIPPEAIPIVLDVSMESKQTLTIREAKWLGRLYKLLIMIASQQGNASPSFFGGIATFYATTERINELMTERVSPTMDKILWELLTKCETPESITETYKREFHPGMKDDRFRMGEDGQLYYRVTKAEWALLEKEHRSLGLSTPFDDFSALGITLEVKEDKDE